MTARQPSYTRVLVTIPTVLHALLTHIWFCNISLAVQVNYVGKAANLYEDAGYKLHGSSYVINKYLGTTWLWDRVRVSGGAYGGFSDFDSHSGMFTYLSYRDPNLLKTVDNYDGKCWHHVVCQMS